MNEENFKKITQSLMDYCRQELGYEEDPDVRYVRDEENARAMLGSTANYNPSSKVVTVYISNRHPKDILRSVAHELVHHHQCCRGDLDNSETPPGYAQKDPHMRNMEKEAYLKGNMMFRDWEDHTKQSGNLLTLRFIGENNMKDLKDYINEEVEKLLKKMGKSKKGKKEAEKKIDEVGAVHSGKPGARPIGDDDARYSQRFGGSGMHQGPGKARPKGMIDTDLARAKDEDYRRTKSYCEAEGKDEFGGDVQRCMDEMLYDNPPSSHMEEGSMKKTSELTQVKKNQDSIKSLNENRLMNLNKRLMEKFLK